MNTRLGTGSGLGTPTCSHCGSPLTMDGDMMGSSMMVMGGTELTAMMAKVVKRPRACEHCQKNFCTECAYTAGKKSGRAGSELACPDCGRSLGSLSDRPSYISVSRPASARPISNSYIPARAPAVRHPAAPAALPDGKWKCPNCGGINPAKKDHCLGCNAYRYDPPKPAAASSKPAEPKTGTSSALKIFMSFMAGFTVAFVCAQIYQAIWPMDPNGNVPPLFVPAILIIMVGTFVATWKGLGRLDEKRRNERIMKNGQAEQVEKMKAGGDKAGLIKIPDDQKNENVPASAAQALYGWDCFENRAQGIRLPHPKHWVADEQGGKIIFHAPQPRQIGGGILDLAMTLVCMDTSASPLANAGDMAICRKFMETMLSQAGGRLEWSEEGNIPTGQPAIWFGYSFQKAGCNLKAVCVLVHKDHSMYYLDVTGMAELVDDGIDEWKGIVHALEVRK